MKSAVIKQQFERYIPVLACGGIGMLHSLELAGIPVYAGYNNEQNVTPYSRHIEDKIHLSDYNTGKFIEKLCEFGKKQPQKIVLMTDYDQALLTISRHRDELKEDYLFLLPHPETVEIIQDKRRFYQEASKYNLPVPVSFAISSLQELQAVDPKIIYPCILKPVYTEDWHHKDFSTIVGPYKKAMRCSDREELFSMYKKVFRIHSAAIVQEYVEGEDHRHYSINMYVDRNGKLKGHYIYRKVRMYPISAGRGSFFVTIYDDEILARALEAVNKLQLCGLINAQFKRDARTGILKLIEMECRLSVSSYLGAASGMNLAALYYHDLLGKSCHVPGRYEPNVKYFDLLRDIKACFQYLKNGDLSFKAWLRSYRGKFVCNGYKLNDPYPLFMGLWFMLRGQFKGQSRVKE